MVHWVHYAQHVLFDRQKYDHAEVNGGAARLSWKEYAQGEGETACCYGNYRNEVEKVWNKFQKFQKLQKFEKLRTC